VTTISTILEMLAYCDGEPVAQGVATWSSNMAWRMNLQPIGSVLHPMTLVQLDLGLPQIITADSWVLTYAQLNLNGNCGDRQMLFFRASEMPDQQPTDVYRHTWPSNSHYNSANGETSESKASTWHVTVRSRGR